MRNRWRTAFQIAAVYVGTVVGAGFATGKEIVEFFSRFGFIGFIAIFISGFMFIYFGAKLMRLSAKIGAKSYEELNIYLFGKIFGTGVNLVVLFMLLGVSAVMLSGAGAVFEEQLELPRKWGILLTIILTIIVMIVGMKGLFAVNVFFVPMMILFSFLLLCLSLRLPHFLDQAFFIPSVEDGWKVKAVISPFSYAAFNIGLAQAVLVPIASEIKDDNSLKWGGILGGSALTTILIANHLTLVMLPNLELYEIPMAIIIKKLASSVYWIFIVIIYSEIFTSIIANIFGLERQIKKYIQIPSSVIVGMILFITYVISHVNYSTLLSLIYPLFGYMSIIFVVLLWLKPLDLPKK